MNENLGFTIKESKFDYFFGRVSSSSHNQNRAFQNKADLRQLGIDEDAGGRERLLQIFSAGLTAPQIGIPHRSDYGITITRRIEVSGTEASGAIDIKYFYPGGNLSTTPEIVTIIPKIYQSP